MTPETIDLWGHVGYLFIFVGLVMIGVKNHNGWLFRLTGEGIWVILGYEMGISSLWTWGLLFMGIDVAAYMLWRKREDF